MTGFRHVTPELAAGLRQANRILQLLARSDAQLFFPATYFQKITVRDLRLIAGVYGFDKNVSTRTHSGKDLVSQCTAMRILRNCGFTS